MEKNIPHFRRLSILVLLLVALCRGVPASGQGNDIRWLRAINEHRNRSLDGLMVDLSASDYPVAVALPLTQLVYGYAAHDKKSIQKGWTTVAGLAVNEAITFGIKYVINRDRPYVTYPDIKPYSYDKDPSFPSGHSSAAFCVATMLSIQYPKWYVIVPSYLWASAIGYSRLHLGMHYPSDVLGGAIVGAGSAFIGYKSMQWLYRRKAERKLHKFRHESE